MRKYPLLLLLLGLSACGNQKESPQQAHIQAALHEIQIELSELKYQMNTHQTELAILEEKWNEERKTLTQVKKQVHSGDSTASKQLRTDVEELRRRLISVDKQSEKASSDLKKLEIHAEQNAAVMAQYKTKLQECQSTIADQSGKLDEIKKLRTTISSLSQAMQGQTVPLEKRTYQVVAGDSLQKIAQKNQTSVTALKRANQLQTDQISVGQELLLPD